MTGRRRLDRSLNALDQLKQNNAIEFPGILGAQFKGQSLVEVPNRDGYVYVRLRSNTNEIVQAYNSVVSPVFDLPVTVIRDSSSNRYIIKSRDLGQYGNWGGSSYQPRHGSQHSFPDNNWGGDIVWIYGRQFTPLCVTPATGTSGGNYVFVNPYVYYLNGIWDYVGGVATPNLLGNKPTGTGAVPVLIYLDISGTVQTLAGSNFSSSDTTIDAIIPHLPGLPNSSCVPLGVVRLTSGTSVISWNEIFDLRPLIDWWSSVTGSSGGGGHTIENEGTPLAQRAKLNFKGSTVWAVDNAGDDATDIIISGSSAMVTGSYVNIVREAMISFPGNLFVTNNPLRIYNKLGISQTISQIFLSVGTPPSGSTIIVDIHKNGTTIFSTQSNRPVVLVNAFSGYSTTIDDPTWGDGDYLTANIDQIGSGTAGADLVAHIIYNSNVGVT